MNLSFQKLFFAIATVFVLFAILILAKSILIPLGSALMISFILYPLVKKFELWGINKIISAFLSIFGITIIIGGGIFLFSTQIVDLVQEFSNFQDKIIFAFTDLTLFVNENMSFVPIIEKHELFDQIKAWLHESTGMLVEKTFSNTATLLYGMIATITFTFLFLIYRTGLIKALSEFSPKEKREKVVKMYQSVQQVGQKYLFGMVILLIVIGFANSIGLWIIGIENPFLFGFLGAFLSIIPYIGTVAGAILPTLYAFISYDSLGMVLAVILLFWAVQLISDNILSPKIVGGSININALATILSLIVGAAVWGIAGMILFLPFTAMLKIVCEEYEELKPIGRLIGNQNYQENDQDNKWVGKIKVWYKKVISKQKKSAKKQD
jgi:predicted PurR-regulated permease PerM